MIFVASIWDCSQERRDVLKNLFYPYHNDFLVSFYYVRHYDPCKLRSSILKLPKEKRLWLDSGGFQIMTKKVHIDPNDVYQYQLKSLQAGDVAFTLDIPSNPTKTFENAKIALNFKKQFEDQGIKLYAVITLDSSLNPEVARKFAKKINKLDFDGIAIGALTKLCSRLWQIGLIIASVKSVTTKPIHVMGVSGYDLMYLLAWLDIDSFDSNKHLKGAKYREYHLITGSLAYVGNHHAYRRRFVRNGFTPCFCPACLQMKKLEKFQESDAKVVAYLAAHNFFVMMQHLRLITLAKDEGWFERLLQERMLRSSRLRKAIEILSRTSLVSRGI